MSLSLTNLSYLLECNQSARPQQAGRFDLSQKSNVGGIILMWIYFANFAYGTYAEQ